LWEHLIDNAGDKQRDARFHGVAPGPGMKFNCGTQWHWLKPAC
jgi:hypothetical protein